MKHIFDLWVQACGPFSDGKSEKELRERWNAICRMQLQEGQLTDAEYLERVVPVAPVH